MKHAGAVILYRESPAGLEILLVHPSGNYNRKAPWGFPKGEPEPGETMEETARRELGEETGVKVGDLTFLGTCRYTKSRKTIHGFYAQAPDGVEPAVASWEIDKAEFVPLPRALQIIHPDQRRLLEQLVAQLDPTA